MPEKIQSLLDRDGKFGDLIGKYLALQVGHKKIPMALLRELADCPINPNLIGQLLDHFPGQCLISKVLRGRVALGPIFP